MGKAIDIFSLSGMKYPIHILAPTFSTVSLVFAQRLSIRNSSVPNPFHLFFVKLPERYSRSHLSFIYLCQDEIEYSQPEHGLSLQKVDYWDLYSPARG